MMLKVFPVLLLVCLLGGSMPLAAQQPDAQEIIERTATAFRQAGGIEARFTAQTSVKGKQQATSTGTISLKGEQFVLDAEGSKTWFDGRTQWSYLASSDEVNVSQPTAEELQAINPYALLSMYKQGYGLKMGKNTTYRGTPAYELILTATNKQQDLLCVILYVSKDTLQPLCISMSQRGGATVVVRITSFRKDCSYPDGFFAFDKKAYPTAEVIDLR